MSMSSSSTYPSSRRHGGTAPPPPAPGSLPAAEARDWALLPRDIVLDIFLRLGPLEVMLGAEFACKPWRSVALEEPMVWRRVGMENASDEQRRCRHVTVEMAMKLFAVDRAAGQCEAFQGYCDERYLLNLVKRAPSLKYLRIEHYSDCQSGENLIKALKNLTQLEELEIRFKCTFDDWDHNMLQSLCQACPHLKKLVLTYTFVADIECNEDEFSKQAIDGEIPMMLKLHTLELYECGLTGKGLKAILDSCPLLETLHIGGYFNKSEMDKDLRKKCARVKNLTLPTKSWYDIYFDEGMIN